MRSIKGDNVSMKKLVSTVGIDEKIWLAYRKKGIGGSDAGAVCGLNPYRSAMAVYLDKTTEETEQVDNCFLSSTFP